MRNGSAGAGTSRSPLIAAGLGAAVLMTGVLAYQAVDAHRSHREVVEKTLRENALTAAWQFIGESQRQLDARFLHSGLEVAAFAGGKDPAVPFGDSALVLQRNRDKQWCWPECASSLFRFDMVGGRAAWARPAADGAVDVRSVPLTDVEGWLLDAVRAGEDAMGERWDYASVIQGDRIAVWRWYEGGDGQVTAYGFTGPVAPMRALLSKVFETSPLLPLALTSGRPNDEFVALDVVGPQGTVLATFDSGADAAFEATLPFDPAFGGLSARARVRRDAAAALVIGGLPASRLPLIVGLMALTVALLGAAIVLIRQEAELARLRSDFVSGVSHELRTPLAQIRLFAETLQLGRVRDESERTRSLDVLVGETRRLTHLVENVLLFSRGQREGLALKPEKVDVSELVRSVCDSFSPLAARAGQRLEAEVPAGVEAVVDPDALRQALLNLLDNAVKYGPRGQRVKVRLSPAGPADAIELSVEDEGPGIPGNAGRSIFEPYFRLAHDRASATAGSGIGLSVVAQVARAHGGSVTVGPTAPHSDDVRSATADASGRGPGARFVVRIPVGALPALAHGTA